MNDEWITELDAAVSEVFSLMLGRRCQPDLRYADLSGYEASVGFSGTLRGSCTVRLDYDAARSLTEELTGEASPADCLDTVGELCNMIAGSWKSRLPGDASACKLSIPHSGPVGLAAKGAELCRYYRCEGVSLILLLSLDLAA